MANKSGSGFNTTSNFNSAVKVSLLDGELAMFGSFTGSVPTDAGEFAPGCVLIKTDAAGGTAQVYSNQGTAASPSFVELT